MIDMLTHVSHLPVLAEAAITWTPTTYYVAMGIVHVIAILLGFRLLQVDPEHNSFVGAVIAAVMINVIAFFVRDTGVVGILIAGGAMFGLLVAISSGEVLKASLMTLICVALYAAVGSFVLERTPLTEDEVGGFTRVVLGGGLEAEPITEEDAKKLSAPAGQQDEDEY